MSEQEAESAFGCNDLPKLHSHGLFTPTSFTAWDYGETNMPGSRASVFGEAEDFQAALCGDGVAGMLFTGSGPFRARMTQVNLERLRLAAVEEAQSRIAFVEVPGGMVSVSFPIDRGPSPIWGGIEIRTGEMVAFGPGERLHARTIGACHWGGIQVPAQQLADYGRAVNGTRLLVPSAARWRPPRGPERQIRDLHRAAIRTRGSASRPSGSTRAGAAITGGSDRVFIGRPRRGSGEGPPSSRHSRSVRGSPRCRTVPSHD